MYTNTLYIQVMQYEWDPAKNASNLEKHGVSFETIHGFQWATAISRPAVRGNELRYWAIGYIGDRLHVVVFTMRGENVCIISMWKAGRGDRRDYAQA